MFRNAISLLFFLVIFGGGGYLWLEQSRQLPKLAAVDSLVAVQDVQASDAPSVKVIDPVLGKKDAPVTIMEYASFTCPHCAHFHTDVFDVLKKEYVDTGKVKFIMRDVYFDRFGLWAAMLARCDSSKFFGISDLVYTKQREWTKGDSPAQIVDNLRKIGKIAGLSEEQMNTCLTDTNKARALVTAYQTNADKDGINATPSFIINGKHYPNMSLADFKKTIDGLLAKSNG